MMRSCRHFRIAIVLLLAFNSFSHAGDDHALIIGIRNYDPDQLVALPSAEKDADRMADLLQRIGYTDQRLTLLTNSAGSTAPRQLPTRNNILKRLEQISERLDADDQLLFTFSGHGIQTRRGTYYLCPFDGDLSDTDSLIPIDEVFAMLQKCRSRKKLVLLDAMQSQPFAVTFDPALAKTFFNRMPSLPALPSDTAVYVACSHGQSSDSKTRNGSGNFFDTIVRGVQGEAAGADGSVTLPDVQRYIKQQFASASFQPQLYNNVSGLITVATHSLGENDLDNIEKLIRGDRYSEAGKIVDARLTTHPDDATALAQRARLIAYEAEQFRRYTKMDQAVAAAEKAVRLAPNEPLPYVARANVFRIQKKYEKSLADASTAVRLDPNCVMAHVIRGFAMHHLHDLEGMGREARKGLEIDPESPEARATLVAYLFAKARLDEGHAQLDRAIAITPDMPALYFLKGYGYEKQSKHRQAIEQYNKAIALNDQIPSYLCRRAISHANAGNHQAAMADVAAAEKVDPQYFDIASVRAMVIQKLRGYGHSEDAIAAGLEANPDSVDLWWGRGFNFFNRGQYPEAIKSFEKALEINPGYGEAHMGMGMVYAKLGRLDKALVHLNRATRHKEHLSRAYFEKCSVYITRRDYGNAIKELEKAMEIEPGNRVFRQQRQQLRMLTGR